MSLPKLKLNLNTLVSKAQPTATPNAITPGGSKFKLKLNTKSTPSTPIVPEQPLKSKKAKAPKASKTSAKVIESRKRIKHESDSEAEGSSITIKPQNKKIKLALPPSNGVLKTPAVSSPRIGAPLLKAKLKGKPPKRTPGEGYDSEASDRENDPAIEEEFILRMVPGDDCDYLRQAIIEKRVGLPPNQGGADIQMKFFHAEGRRAAVTIRKHLYAATLVDLPCIIEGMKSWDKRGWWKSADICQMLWVFAPIAKEEDAKDIALPIEVDSQSFQFPHGLTPPLHFARKRRFRNRISRTAIEAVEEAVEKLLADDQEAESSKWEMFDPEAERESHVYSPGPGSSPGYDDGQDEYSGDEDADGEADPGYFINNHNDAPPQEQHDDDFGDLEAELEAAMAEDVEGEPPTPMSNAATPSMATGGTPALGYEEEDDSGDESIEGEDDDEDTDEPPEMDEDEKARLAQIQGTEEDIADLAKQIEGVQAQLATQANPILRKRLEENARKLKAELQLKKSSIGEGDDN